MSDIEIDRVLAALRAGDLAVIPTDTVYGLIADPTSAVAMRKLFDLKQRPGGVPIAVLVGSVDQARELIESNPAFERLAAAHWPGALTLVAPMREELGLHIGSRATLGVRFPAHDLVQEIGLAFGPIAATSANVHGSPTIASAAEAMSAFHGAVDVIIDRGVLEGTASTVVDISVDPAIVLRQGEVAIRPES